MSETNNHKREAQLFGVAKKQKLSRIQNEDFVLFSLARFGWLTSHQVAEILWPQKPSGNDLSRRILSSLNSQSFVSFQIMTRSPGKQIKAFYLSTKGMNRVLENPDFKSLIKVKKTKRSITDDKYQYHRLLSNQVLIDIRRARLKLPFCDPDSGFVLMSEHEMRPYRKSINAHLGCIPDGLVKVDSTMLVIEVENSVRGPARHGSKLRQEGNKLEAWLPPYIERLRSQGRYSDHLLPLGKNGEYSDAKEIFVCTSEKIFRSIWRKMRGLLGQFNKETGYFYYIILNKQLWVDPLRSDNIQILEHNSQEAVQLVAVGEERTRRK